jgi:hypothetical protein
VLHRQQFERFDLHLHFLAALAYQRGFGMLVPVDVATGQAPQPAPRFDVAPPQQDAPAIFDQGDDDDFGIAKEDAVAVGTSPQVLIGHQPRFSLRSAAGAIGNHRFAAETGRTQKC